MSVYGGGGTCPPFNPDFAKAVPTNGFGEVEATVNASLGHPGAPRPRSISMKLSRKVCRIYSPVSTPRAGYMDVRGGGIGSLKNGPYQQRDASLRPHTADAALMYRPSSRVADEVDQVGGASEVVTAPCLHASDATESARLVMVQQRRPMTSDGGASQRQKLQRRRGLGAGRIGASSTVNDAMGGQLRPSTSVGGRRRPPAVSHGGFDTGRVASSSNAPGIEGNCEQQREQQQKSRKPPNQEERLLQEETKRRQQILAVPSTSNVNRFEPRPTQNGAGTRRGDNDPSPNKYWPTPGGAKEFLRPFIERNQRRLWAYDPALVGLNHVEAYHHLASKGNFEAVKRTLLEKEDALTKGTGSLLMAHTIERFRGGSARGPATGEHPERRRSQRPVTGKPLFSRASRGTATESDPFQPGSCNADTLRRQRARRQDLLVQAKTRNTVFLRRKGYEPGDFLKHRVTDNNRGGGREISARSAAAASAAAEAQRKAHRHREGGQRVLREREKD